MQLPWRVCRSSMRTPASGMRTDAAAAASECTTMSTSLCPYITALVPGDRKHIRRMLNQFFGSLPTVTEAFPLRTWRRGPYKGLPKLPRPRGAWSMAA